jgi:hypothetical protein
VTIRARWRQLLDDAILDHSNPERLEAIRDEIGMELGRLAALREEEARMYRTATAALERIGAALDLPSETAPGPIADKACGWLAAEERRVRPEERDPADWRRILAYTLRDHRTLSCVLEGIAIELEEARAGATPQVQVDSPEEMARALDRIRRSFSLVPWSPPFAIAFEAERRAVDVGAQMKAIRDRLGPRE